MKKTKIIMLVIVLAVICSATIALVSCGRKHALSADWDYDSTYHWYNCSKCDEQVYKAKHAFTKGVCSECGVKEAAIDLVYELSEDGSYAICTGLKEGSTATSIEIMDTYQGKPVTTIKQEAFKGNTTIKKAVLPGSFDVIGFWAFQNNTALKEVVLKEGLTKIGYGMFEGCTALTSIDIPASVESVGERAFYGCTALSNVKLKDGLKEIDHYAFKNTAIEEFVLPKSVTSVGRSIFTGAQLKTVVLSATDNVVEFDTNQGAEGAFRASSVEEVIIEEGFKYGEADSLFSQCKSLKKVVIAKDFKATAEKMFNGCSALIDIQFGGIQEEWTPIWTQLFKSALFELGDYTVTLADGTKLNSDNEVITE